MKTHSIRLFKNAKCILLKSSVVFLCLVLSLPLFLLPTCFSFYPIFVFFLVHPLLSCLTLFSLSITVLALIFTLQGPETYIDSTFNVGL